MYSRTKSHDKSSNHPTIQSSEKVTEKHRMILIVDVQTFEVVQWLCPTIFKPFPVEEENPDYGEWDTDVM